METTTKVKDCRNCPHRYSHSGQGECWSECSHPNNGKGCYDNILYGCFEKFEKTPEWCPLKNN